MKLLVIDSSPVAIAVNDQQQNIIYLNKKCIEIFGYTLDDIPTVNAWWPLAYPDPAYRQKVRTEWHEAVEKAVREKAEIGPLEYKVACRDGSVRDIQFGLTPVGDLDLVIFNDITERKRAETALRESEERFRGALENIPDVVVIYDRDLRIQYINEATRRLTGRPASDFIGHREEEIWPPEVYEVYLPTLREALETRKICSLETNLLFPGDILRNLSITCVPLLNEKSEVREILGITRDFTERNRAEVSLRESEERYRNLLEVAPVGITVHSEGKIVFTNPAGLKLLGAASYDQLIGKPIAEIIHPEGLEKARDRIQRMMAGEKGLYPAEDVYLRLDGKPIDVEVMASSLTFKGKPAVQVIVTDITEHRKLEAQYYQAQKMESIGTLAGGVAHDFNNILSAIIGYGHVALMKMAGDDPQRPNIESMLEAADRAAHLTQDLLLFSRKQVSELKPVDLNKVVGQVEKFLKRVIGEDIACKKTVTDHPLTVFADSHQLEQVLMNLATNARDAMPGGGAFTIQTEQVDLHEDFTRAHGFGKPGPYAMITVSDTGKGMDEETRKRIFEPFFTTKEVGKGTGLGLAVVYGIIKQHDGFINVYSEPGKGTTFRIYLPIITAVVTEETKAQKKEAPARGTETVLLAEDDEALRKLSRIVLTQNGYTVIEAVDGEDAVRKFRKNKDRIHILLFDLIMPKMNGKEAYDEIRKIRPDMKVLFASGYAPDIVWQKASLEPGSHLIYKPVSPMELLRKVRSVLDGATQ